VFVPCVQADWFFYGRRLACTHQRIPMAPVSLPTARVQKTIPSSSLRNISPLPREDGTDRLSLGVKPFRTGRRLRDDTFPTLIPARFFFSKWTTSCLEELGFIFSNFRGFPSRDAERPLSRMLLPTIQPVFFPTAHVDHVWQNKVNQTVPFLQLVFPVSLNRRQAPRSVRVSEIFSCHAPGSAEHSWFPFPGRFFSPL